MIGLLTLAGAIVVALITALTTDRRLSRQIEDERERQERALTAEARRQAAVLAHDRELADLTDLRALFDEAAYALDRAEAAREEARKHFRFLTESTPTHAREKGGREAGEAVEQSVASLITMTARLRVRLGSADPITVSVSNASRALEEIRFQALLLIFANDEDVAKSLAALKNAGEDFSASAEAFFAAAVERAGTVPMQRWHNDVRASAHSVVGDA